MKKLSIFALYKIVNKQNELIPLDELRKIKGTLNLEHTTMELTALRMTPSEIALVGSIYIMDTESIRTENERIHLLKSTGKVTSGTLVIDGIEAQMTRLLASLERPYEKERKHYLNIN